MATQREAGHLEQQEQHAQRPCVGSGHISGARGRHAISVLRVRRVVQGEAAFGHCGQ